MGSGLWLSDASILSMKTEREKEKKKKKITNPNPFHMVDAQPQCPRVLASESDLLVRDIPWTLSERARGGGSVRARGGATGRGALRQLDRAFIAWSVRLSGYLMHPFCRWKQKEKKKISLKQQQEQDSPPEEAAVSKET
jgi:hypothetical protein